MEVKIKGVKVFWRLTIFGGGSKFAGGLRLFGVTKFWLSKNLGVKNVGI